MEEIKRKDGYEVQWKVEEGQINVLTIQCPTKEEAEHARKVIFKEIYNDFVAAHGKLNRITGVAIPVTKETLEFADQNFKMSKILTLGGPNSGYAAYRPANKPFLDIQELDKIKDLEKTSSRNFLVLPPDLFLQCPIVFKTVKIIEKDYQFDLPTPVVKEIIQCLNKTGRTLPPYSDWLMQWISLHTDDIIILQEWSFSKPEDTVEGYMKQVNPNTRHTRGKIQMDWIDESSDVEEEEEDETAWIKGKKSKTEKKRRKYSE